MRQVMKSSWKRILSLVLALCLAAGLSCMTAETAQAAAYKKTIKKTIKFKAAEGRVLNFKVKSSASATITVTLKGDTKSGQHYATVIYKGAGKEKYVEVFGVKGRKKASEKVKLKKGAQHLLIASGGRATMKVVIEIKAKKPVLQFRSVKKPAQKSTPEDVG